MIHPRNTATEILVTAQVPRLNTLRPKLVPLSIQSLLSYERIACYPSLFTGRLAHIFTTWGSSWLVIHIWWSAKDRRSQYFSSRRSIPQQEKSAKTRGEGKKKRCGRSELFFGLEVESAPFSVHGKGTIIITKARVMPHLLIVHFDIFNLFFSIIHNHQKDDCVI